jgi:hypothetical protein
MFVSDIRQWDSVSNFQQHLYAHSPAVCSWVSSAIIHHTWRPRQKEWRGLASMESLRRFYMGKGWSAGPHLFICVGAPNPAHDGIFQLTPLNAVGVHAGVCNSSTWGIEVVGDYDDKPWDDQTMELVADTIATLFRWNGISPNMIRGHRECRSPKTCPGKAVSIPVVQQRVREAIAHLP